MKKLAFVATAATALLCVASLAATSADAKTRHHKKPATAVIADSGPGAHQPGGPMRSGNMCWKDVDPWANRGLGYWAACPK